MTLSELIFLNFDKLEMPVFHGKISITRLSDDESEEITAIAKTPSPMSQSSYMGGEIGTAGNNTDPTVGGAPYHGKFTGQFTDSTGTL